MNSPPPPPPPPPPPQEQQEQQEQPAAATAAPIPPPLPLSNEFRQAATAAAAQLEAARCHETELQAWTALSASQLRYSSNASSGFTVEVADEESSALLMPGSCVDAWQAVARAAAQKEEGDEEEALLQQQQQKHHHHQHSTPSRIEIPPGQQSVAVQTICTANSLQRMAELAQTVKKERAECATQWKQVLQPQLTTASNNNTNNNTSQWWLQALDERLQEIRKYHAEHSSTASASSTTGAMARKHNRHGNPVADGYDLAATIEQWTHQLDTALFSVDEVRGKYLDLHSLYEQLLHIGNNTNNIKMQQQSFPSQLRSNSNNNGDSEAAATKTKQQQQQQQYQYIDFLEDLSQGLGRVWHEPAKLKQRRKYLRWLLSLQDYLVQFLQKTVPLLPVQPQVIDRAERDFANEWSQSGGATGWKAVPAEAILAQSSTQTVNDAAANNTDDNDQEKSKQTTTTTNIDLAAFASAEELAAQVDGDLLKAELSLLGLKSGGTVMDRAKRLFLLKNSKLEDLPPKVFAKNTKKQQQQQQVTTTETETNPSSAATGALLDRRIDLARAECIVTALLDQVRPKLEATIRRTERRQTQTLKEREREMADELFGAGVVLNKKPKTNNGNNDTNDSDSDDEDDAPIYNPKNVPLDWDGKPIPYWLFKLHGLNHYYGCEICGGESYRGRRNFELHFAEQRHAAGMKALGIPNTKHFHGVTKIEDAQDLWKSLQDKLTQEQFDGTRDEEYEDASGNVLSQQKYEDLARQGLL